jgi:DNA-binding NarL/FixJ family response regulator
MNILIADHHPVYRLGIKTLLQQRDDLSFVGKVNDGKKLLTSLKEYLPDLLILEIDLPNVKGLNCLREIKSNYPALKVLVVSCQPEGVYALSAIKAGAAGYIEKTSSEKNILNAIIDVSQGKTYLSQDILKLQAMADKNRNALKYRKLSTREIEVLKLLTKGRRNKEVAQALNINEKTVSTYKTRLLKKLNVDNIADLINHSRLMEVMSIDD